MNYMKYVEKKFRKRNCFFFNGHFINHTINKRVNELYTHS